jgi:hypothetical protein
LKLTKIEPRGKKDIKRSIISSEITEVKSPGPERFTDEIYQTFEEELTPTLLKLFHKIGRNMTKFIL